MKPVCLCMCVRHHRNQWLEGLTNLRPGFSGSFGRSSCTGSNKMLSPYKRVVVAPSISTTSTRIPYLRCSIVHSEISVSPIFAKHFTRPFAKLFDVMTWTQACKKAVLGSCPSRAQEDEVYSSEDQI